MPFLIPSLGDLVERTRRAFRSNLPGSDAWLWPNNINPTAKVIAGATHEVFGFADYIARQKFAITADSEHLDLHGEELGLARRPAEPARGYVTITPVDGATVTVGALFERLDGRQYRALAGTVIAGSAPVDVEVVATTDGVTGHALPGTGLTAIAGVSGDVLIEVASGGIVGGADIEGDEAFRERILFRKRYPPHGGSASDYVMWASSLSGVTRVFVERLWTGPGTVRVFPLFDDLHPHGIAPYGGADILRVRDYLDIVRPAGAIVTVESPTARPIDIAIDDLAPDTPDLREAVLAELRAMFLRRSRVAGQDEAHPSMPFLAHETSFSRSWIWQAIANATGEDRHIVVSPAADVALDAGEIATLGDVTFS